MSVHGEYARALGGVLARLAEWQTPEGQSLRLAFEAAEATPTRDLSLAARQARVALGALDAWLGSGRGELAGGDRSGPDAGADAAALREACRHLQAHCDAILGVERPRG